MVIEGLATEIVIDILRSGWVVEAARARVYETWAEHDDRFHASRDRAARQADIVARVLATENARADDALVDAHARWVQSVVGGRPGEVAFADLFVVRLGDWVEAHVGPFLGEAGDELQALTEKERAAAAWPDELPAPPPFAPLDPVAVEPPGDVRFRFGILSDLHIGAPVAEPLVRAAIDDLNRSGAEIVVQLGDITDHGDRSEFEIAARILGELEMPVVTTIGNHDAYSYEEGALRGRDYYARYFGRSPSGTIVEHDGVRLAVLDSVDHAVSPFAPFNLVTGSFAEGRGGAVVRGRLSPEQHDILAELAAPGSGPVFVFMHHPPQPFTSFPPILFGLRDADSGRLHATCDSGNVWGVFAGHTHRNARSQPFGRIPAVEVGIPRDHPFGYALVDVTSSGYSYRWLQISDRDLVAESGRKTGEIQRRYATGNEAARAFTWRAG